MKPTKKNSIRQCRKPKRDNVVPRNTIKYIVKQKLNKLNTMCVVEKDKLKMKKKIFGGAKETGSE